MCSSSDIVRTREVKTKNLLKRIHVHSCASPIASKHLVDMQVTWSHKRVQIKMISHLLIEGYNICSNIVQLVLSVLLLLVCGFSFPFFILALFLPF